MRQGNILIVDDDEDVLTATMLLLEQHFSNVRTEKNPEVLPKMLGDTGWDVILLDMNFTADTSSGVEGLTWLKRIRSIDPSAVVILITAYGHVEMAVQSMKEGATDFVLKPWQNEKLLATVSAAYELKRSRSEAETLRTQKMFLNETIDESYQKFLGESRAMQLVFESVSKVAPTNANVLILGEHGTGKELAARLLHRRSQRAKEIFVAVDMGSISESLFESELFGNVRGAFTDAKVDRPGRLEIADKGTLFLDEIGNVPLHLQSKLLVVLQDRQVFRVGSTVPHPIDVRLICATNASHDDLANEKKFRKDLLYRINTVEITLPPLRERDDDIELLAQHYVQVFSKRSQTGEKTLSSAALRKLRDHSWPGNVRELQHAIERAVILSDSATLQPENFALIPRQLSGAIQPEVRMALGEIEMATIQKVLQKHNWNISLAAQELGITRASLYRRMRKHGL